MVRTIRVLLVLVLVAVWALVAVPSTSFAQSVDFGRPAQLATADPNSSVSHGDDDGSGLGPTVEHALMGTALLAGAFTLGLVASGSLSTAMATAAGVALTYAVLP